MSKIHRGPYDHWVLDQKLTPLQIHTMEILMKSSGFPYDDNGWSLESIKEGAVYFGWAQDAFVLQHAFSKWDKHYTFDKAVEFIKDLNKKYGS